MPIRSTPFAEGTPCWVDRFTSDVDAACTFYHAVFGWEPHPAPSEFGGYLALLSDGEAVAGLMPNSDRLDIPDLWSTYIATDDVGSSARAAVAAGGRILSPPMDFGDLGGMAILQDTTDGVFALWKSGRHIGFTKHNEHASVCWHEYHSTSFSRSLQFYGSVFGWALEPTSDTDAFRYHVAKVQGRSVAGVMDAARFLPPEVQSRWTVYFQVNDVDEAAAAVADNGGAVLRPPADTAFGRISEVLDPAGAAFSLHSPNLAGG